MRKKKLILFDFDGTIVDSNNIKELGFQQVYENYGNNKKKLIIDYHRKNTGLSRFKKFEYINRKFLKIEYNEKIGQNLSNKFSNCVVNEIVKAPYIKGALEFLEKNYENLAIYLFSATPLNELKVILNKKKIKSYFREIFGAPEDKNSIFLKIINKTGINKDNILIVGDSISDFKVAEKFGVDFIGVGNLPHNHFSTETILIDDLMKLENYIN